MPDPTPAPGRAGPAAREDAGGDLDAARGDDLDAGRASPIVPQAGRAAGRNEDRGDDGGAGPGSPGRAGRAGRARRDEARDEHRGNLDAAVGSLRALRADQAVAGGRPLRGAIPGA